MREGGEGGERESEGDGGEWGGERGRSFPSSK